jgi:uncharacterized protein YjbJ (UPF0337 family)
MNWNRIEGNWKHFKGKAKQQWGKLAEDRFDVIAGKREQLVGAIQEAYGIAWDEAERQVAEWGNRCERMLDREARREMTRAANASQ